MQKEAIEIRATLAWMPRARTHPLIMLNAMSIQFIRQKRGMIYRARSTEKLDSSLVNRWTRGLRNAYNSIETMDAKAIPWIKVSLANFFAKGTLLAPIQLPMSTHAASCMPKHVAIKREITCIRISMLACCLTSKFPARIARLYQDQVTAHTSTVAGAPSEKYSFQSTQMEESGHIKTSLISGTQRI